MDEVPNGFALYGGDPSAGPDWEDLDGLIYLDAVMVVARWPYLAIHTNGDRDGQATPRDDWHQAAEHAPPAG